MKKLNFLKFFCLTHLIFLLTSTGNTQTCLTDWEYRVPITIDNSRGEDLINYEMKLIIDTETPISMGQMNALGSDIRFTSGACCDQLYYFLESDINTDATILWVKIPEISSGESITINLFYGNESALDASLPDSVFSFWEGFDDIDLNMDHLCGATYSWVSDGDMHLSWANSSMYGSDITFPIEEVYTGEAKVNSTSGNWPGIFWAKSGSNKSYGLLKNAYDSEVQISYTQGLPDFYCGSHNWASDNIPYSDPSGIWALTWKETGNIIGEFPSLIDPIVSTHVGLARTESLRLCIGAIEAGTGSMDVDWLRARKYTSIPPTFTIGIPTDFFPADLLDLGADIESCESVTLDAGLGYVSYNWNTGGSDQTEVVSVSDIYSVEVVDGEGCTQKDSVLVTIGESYSLMESTIICYGTSYSFPDGTTVDNITSTYVYTSNLETEGLACDSIIETTVEVYEFSPVLDLGSDIISCDDFVILHAGLDFDYYEWGDGSTNEDFTASISGSYTVEVLDDNSCTQTDEITVTLLETETEVTITDFTITALETDAIYTWLDCDNDYAIIDGEIGMSFTAIEDGSYAVEITKEGCTDTSACINILGVSLAENSSQNFFQLYPNPTNENFTITLNNKYENTTIIIRNVEGKIITQISANNQNKFEISLLNEKGVYFVEIITDKEKATLKVVKI